MKNKNKSQQLFNYIRNKCHKSKIYLTTVKFGDINATFAEFKHYEKHFLG